MASVRVQRREKFIALVAEPERLEEFCDEIAAGATLVDIATKIGANYRWLYAWFNDVDFPERGEKLVEAMNARDSMAKESIVGQLHRLGNLDIRDAYDKAGNMLPVHQLPDHVAKAVVSIDVTENEKGDVTKKVRFTDRGQMLALGGRRQKLFVDKVEMTGQMSLEQAVMESVKPRE